MGKVSAPPARRKAKSARPSRVVCWHVCPANRVRSILAAGILPTFSQGARAESWLVRSSKREWAIEHVRIRHRTDAVAVVRVCVPRAWLTRRKRGVYTCPRPILPAMIQAIRPAAFCAG